MPISSTAAPSTNADAKRGQGFGRPGTSSELEIDELVIRIVADLEQHDREHDPEGDGDRAPGRKLVNEGPGGWADGGDQGGNDERAPFEPAAEGCETEQRLIDAERRINARRAEGHPAKNHEEEGQRPSEPSRHRQTSPTPEHPRAKTHAMRHAPGDETQAGPVPKAAERHRREQRPDLHR